MGGSVFHWIDYVVFTITLLMSVAVGIFYAAKDSRNKNNNRTEQFLLAGRKMSVLPVSISLFVSWTSAISLLGDPVEVYYHGIVYVYSGIGYALACPVVAHLFAPFFFNLNITSVYEYLEKRYNMLLRYVSCVVITFCSVLYLAIVLYGPSVALSQVTGMPKWVCITVIGVVGTLYTTLGGMKAVLWVDTFQSVIMLAGVITLAVLGTVRAGGAAHVLHTASQHGRMNLLKASFNPLIRSTVWSYLVGGFCRIFVPYISAQVYIQRYNSLSKPSDAKLAVYWNMPMYLVLVSLFGILGLVMFAYYEGCDPLQEGIISSPNQLVPLFMLDVLGALPGLSGLFLACLFAASLSSLSSTMNAISANFLVDIYMPVYKYLRSATVRDGHSLCMAKLTSVVCGAIVVLLAFVVLYSGGELFSMTVKIAGIFGSPTAALFFMGRLCPFVDSISASIGYAAGLGISMWWGLGAMLCSPPSQALPLPPSTCVFTDGNATFSTPYTYTSSPDTAHESPLRFEVTDLYGLSPLLFSPLGLCTSVIVACTTAGTKKIINRICCRPSHNSEYNMAPILTTDTVPCDHHDDKSSIPMMGIS